MANKIFMADANQGNLLNTSIGGFDLGAAASSAKLKTWDVFPLHDDPQLDIGSEFGSISEDLGEIGSLINFVTNWTANLSGQMGQGLMDIKNMMDAPRWNRTKPVNISFSLFFYVKTDPEKDVFDPMVNWMSYSILGQDKNGNFQLPGFSLANTDNFKATITKANNKTKAVTQDKISKISKLIQIFIPGVVYLYPAIVLQATPTYSKERTQNNFSLWGKLDMQVSGIYPANTSIFKNTKSLTKILTG